MADRKPQNNGFSGQTQTHIPALDPPQKPKRNKWWGDEWRRTFHDIKISDVQLEVLMGIMSLYSFLGCYAAGRTSDWVGRRNTIVIHT